MAKPKVIAGELFRQYANPDDNPARATLRRQFKDNPRPYRHLRGVMGVYVVPATIDGQRAFLMGRATGYSDFAGVVGVNDPYASDCAYWDNAHKLSSDEISRLSSIMPIECVYQRVEEGCREFNHIRAVVKVKTRNLPEPWGDELSDEEILHFSGGAQHGMVG